MSWARFDQSFREESWGKEVARDESNPVHHAASVGDRLAPPGCTKVSAKLGEVNITHLGLWHGSVPADVDTARDMHFVQARVHSPVLCLGLALSAKAW